MSPLEDLWEVVRSIPVGSVASYGDVGREMRNPTTGRLVGRWMAQCPDDLPWWRVVDRNGRFPINRRDPRLGLEQGDLLVQDGIEVIDGRVDMARYRR